METEIESFSCRDTNEAPDNYFEGHKCITEQEDFKMVCLSKPVPDATVTTANQPWICCSYAAYFTFVGKQYLVQSEN